jgi:diacylglycerol kinase (ATP)
MTRARHQKGKHHHFVLLANKRAGRYQERLVRKLCDAIKRRGGYYTVFEPESAMSLLKQARQARNLNKGGTGANPSIARRGEVTALVACGGDGTFNLVARAATELNLPVGLLPMGHHNNIARSLCHGDDVDSAIKTIVKGDYRKFDVGFVADQPFFGAVGIGFLPELAELVAGRGTPRWGIRWSQAAAKAAAKVALTKTVIKIDAFRFEVTPMMISVHLLPWAAGLPFSPTSQTDDGLAEIIFDLGTKLGDFSSFARMIHSRKYLYGTDVRLYRGKVISIQPTKDRMLYLDGELVPIPANALTVSVGDRQVEVFCSHAK